MLCLSSVLRLCFRSRYCCTHLRPPHVCQDGHFPGDAVQAVWEALQRGPFLQCKSPSLFFCFSWTDRSPQRVPSHPTLYSAQIQRIACCKAGAVKGVPSSRCVRPRMRSGVVSRNLLTSWLHFSLQHALPLPGFLLLAPNIYHHAVLFSQSGKCCTGGSLLLYLSGPLENAAGGFQSSSCLCQTVILGCSSPLNFGGLIES